MNVPCSQHKGKLNQSVKITRGTHLPKYPSTPGRIEHSPPKLVPRGTKLWWWGELVDCWRQVLTLPWHQKPHATRPAHRNCNHEGNQDCILLLRP